MLETVVVVISVITALVSIPAGAYYLWDRSKVNVPRTVSWRMIERSVRRVIRELNADHFHPDLILAIGRSGAIYGGLLAGNLGNLPMAILDRHLVWDRAAREYVADHSSEIRLSDDCRTVLVVVGEVYSGQSLSVSLERIAPILKGRDVRTASLVRSRSSNVRLDYVGYEVDRAVKPAWILDEAYKRFEVLPRKKESSSSSLAVQTTSVVTGPVE